MDSERKTGEDFYRFLVDHLFDVVIHAGRGGEIFYISPSIRRYGYAPEELVGQSTLSLVYPDDLDRFKRLMEALLAEDGSLPEGPARDWRLRTKSGDGVWVEGRSTTVRRENGRPVEMVVSLREVVARRQARAEVKDLAARYQLLADCSTDVILRYDTHGRIEFASPAIRQFGYDPDLIVGRRFREFVHPDDLDEVLRRHQRLVQGGGDDVAGLQELRVQRTDGVWLWLEASRSPITDEAGRVIGGVSTLRDITKRKAVQAALADSEARYRLLADISTDLIIRYDAAGNIEFASPAVRQLGYEPDQVIGRSLIEFVHPDDRELAVHRLTAMLAGQRIAEQASGEWRVCTASGGWVWLQSNPSLIRDPDGGIVGAVSIFRNVTERRAMEDELRRKQAEAEQAAQAKTEFLANMSHEIRTPLTAIIGFAGLMGTMEDLPPTATKYANRITTASQTLLAVVNDVLDFSKIEAGQIQLDPEPFDPAAFVNETIELVAGQAAAKGLTLRGEMHGDLPPAVNADSSRVRQVLFNLLGNAIKFTGAGEIRVEVGYLAGEGDGALRIAVIDTGVGIAKAAQDRLFQRFSQIDGSISRRFGGTGLGLAICKSLAELMGGAIGVQSEEGKGSTFWFTVAAPPAELIASPMFAPGEAGWTGPPARILIVDDLAVNRELVAIMLATVGLDLSEAANGAEAVEAAMRQTFDLILMDVQMPGMDGLAATRAIRETSELNSGTPIVALSADVMPAQLELFREAGMDDHIGKPISPAELIYKVGLWSARPG